MTDPLSSLSLGIARSAATRRSRPDIQSFVLNGLDCRAEAGSQ
jgi:hypothetical protein